MALPRFPQLKYGPDRQPGAAMPPRLPLAAVYLLEPSSDAAAEVKAEPLTGCAAMLALVRHTMAARLFTAELLRRHTELCARLAGRVPVRRLIYPHEHEILARVEEVLIHAREA